MKRSSPSIKEIPADTSTVRETIKNPSQMQALSTSSEALAVKKTIAESMSHTNSTLKPSCTVSKDVPDGVEEIQTLKSDASQPPSGPAIGVKTAAETACNDPDGEIVNPDEGPYGPLFLAKQKISEIAVAHLYVMECSAAFSALHKTHYLYDAEGIWVAQSEAAARLSVANFVKRLAEEKGVIGVVPKLKTSVLRGVLSHVEGFAPFDKMPAPANHLVPVANGVLDLSGAEPVLRAYSKDDRFTSKTRIRYTKGAKCERFLNELIKPALPHEDDVDLLQRDLGRQLVPGNRAQTLSVLFGEGGSGKSVLINIIEKILGSDKFAHLRSHKLTGRFETHFFHGKTTLVGKDVAPDYLSNAGAATVKSLTGNDRIESEQKYGGKFELVGSFYVMLTANGILPINIQGDRSAWARRLICYRFSRLAPAIRVVNFDDMLIAEEGEGIFSWMLAGYYAHKKELVEHGKFMLTSRQQKLVDTIIDESEGILAFVKDRVEKPGGDNRHNLTSKELYDAYVNFASDKGWKVPSEQTFGEEMASTMLQQFKIQRSNHVVRNDKEVRGYKGLRWKSEEALDTVAA